MKVFLILVLCGTSIFRTASFETKKEAIQYVYVVQPHKQSAAWAFTSWDYQLYEVDVTNNSIKEIEIPDECVFTFDDLRGYKVTELEGGTKLISPLED